MKKYNRKYLVDRNLVIKGKKTAHARKGKDHPSDCRKPLAQKDLFLHYLLPCFFRLSVPFAWVRFAVLLS